VTHRDDVVHRLTDESLARLFERRRLILRGPLDPEAVTRLSAELLTLDADADAVIDLVVDSPGGRLEDGLAALDLLPLLGARVDVLCTGRAWGTAAALVACATGRRRATPRARLGLRLPPSERHGTATEVGEAARELVGLRDALAAMVSAASGQPPARVVDDLERGAAMDAAAALAYGLVDELAAGPS
jgi:ATP-dependent Clp protease, protease subunit